jgi:hypothetical protein
MLFESFVIGIVIGIEIGIEVGIVLCVLEGSEREVSLKFGFQSVGSFSVVYGWISRKKVILVGLDASESRRHLRD